MREERDAGHIEADARVACGAPARGRHLVGAPSRGQPEPGGHRGVPGGRRRTHVRQAPGALPEVRGGCLLRPGRRLRLRRIQDRRHDAQLR